MAEEYHFIWGEVEIIERAICIAKRIKTDAEYSHIETNDFDLDTDTTAIRITIPHDRDLDEERKAL